MNLSSPLAVLKIAEFRNFVMGRFVFIMGLRMMNTLVSWWMYELTGDVFYIGMIGLAEAIPAIGLALYAGYIIDRSEKRRILLITIFLYAICSFILLGTSTQWFHHQFGTKLIIIFVYGVIFLTGAIRAFTGPGFGAIVSSLVPKNLLLTASQISSTTWLIASIIGHGMAGFLIAWVHVTGTFLIIALLIITGLLLLSKIKEKPPKMNVEKKTLEAVAEGLRFVFKTKEVLGALTLDLFAVLFGGAVALVPVYAKDILHVGPIGFGWLNAAADIGAITMVLALTVNPMKKKQGIKLLIAVAGFGISIIVFGLSTYYWLSFIALLAGGVFDGVAAKLMGVIPSVVFGGCMTLFVVVATWIKAPSLKKLEY